MAVGSPPRQGQQALPLDLRFLQRFHLSDELPVECTALGHKPRNDLQMVVLCCNDAESPKREILQPTLRAMVTLSPLGQQPLQDFKPTIRCCSVGSLVHGAPASMHAVRPDLLQQGYFTQGYQPKGVCLRVLRVPWAGGILAPHPHVHGHVPLLDCCPAHGRVPRAGGLQLPQQLQRGPGLRPFPQDCGTQ